MITGVLPMGGRVWADNYYSSYKIAADLRENRIGYIGKLDYS